MRFSKILLDFSNSLVTAIIVLALCIVGAYSGYALWDNNRVYSAVDDIQADLIKIKPSVNPDDDNSPGFEQLLAINPDVCAWLTLDNTNIDYPVLQGKNNLSYINTDVYGNFALSGSIFLDTRNASDFSDSFSLIYGHHMDKNKMFGDMDLYLEKSFFEENRTGVLILPDKTYKIEIIVCLEVPSSEPMIFEPLQSSNNIFDLLDFTEQNALYTHSDTLQKAREEDSPHILALSTCSSEFTDARTVIITLMEPYLQ